MRGERAHEHPSPGRVGHRTAIKYTNAVFDEDQQRWISDAEVAELPYTAFTSKAKAKHVTARLIVRRVRDMNPDNQSELFTAYRYHAVFTNSLAPMLAAERAHRAHAIVEQVIADLKTGPLAHLPSGNFWANSAWLVCATIAFKLTRAAGSLASAMHAKATTGTIRAQLINVPARLARSRALTDPAPAGLVAMGEGLATTSQRLGARTTPAGLTHPAVHQDPTGDHPWRAAGPPGNLGMHHATNQYRRADQVLDKAPTVDPGLAFRRASASDVSGITSVTPRRCSSSRFGRPEYALSARTAAGVVRGRPDSRRGTLRSARSLASAGESCAWPGVTATTSGNPRPSTSA